MMFDAGETQTNLMNKIKLNDGQTGIHWFSPTTSTKQFGDRKSYYVRLTKKGFEFYDTKTDKLVENPESYNVPVKDVRTVLSEKT